MSPAPGDTPAGPIPAASLPQIRAGCRPPSGPPSDPASRAFLAVAAVLFFGWLAWLSYTALTKSREPIVSRSQAALAPPPGGREDRGRRQRCAGKEGGRDRIAQKRRPSAQGHAAGDRELPPRGGFAGPGEYLLLLPIEVSDIRDGMPVFQLLGTRGPGTESDPPTIYRWTPDVAAQAKRLYRAKD